MILRRLRQLFNPMSIPHNPERRRLVSQIKQLQKELSKIDQTNPPSDVQEPPTLEAPTGATTSTTTSNASASNQGGKAGKKVTSETIGPLPPTLANAPKRHVALLFS